MLKELINERYMLQGKRAILISNLAYIEEAIKQTDERINVFNLLDTNSKKANETCLSEYETLLERYERRTQETT
jgi:hypothetical protein